MTDVILVLNAGSSSIKFSMFAMDPGAPALALRYRGAMEGANLFGSAGMFLAIPTITVARVLVASSARHLKAYGLVAP